MRMFSTQRQEQHFSVKAGAWKLKIEVTPLRKLPTLFRGISMHLPSQWPIKRDLDPPRATRLRLGPQLPLHLLWHFHASLNSLHLHLDSLYPLSLHLLSTSILLCTARCSLSFLYSKMQPLFFVQCSATVVFSPSLILTPPWPPPSISSHQHRTAQSPSSPLQ